MSDKIRKAAEKIVQVWIALPKDNQYEQAVKFVEAEIRKASRQSS